MGLRKLDSMCSAIVEFAVGLGYSSARVYVGQINKDLNPLVIIDPETNWRKTHIVREGEFEFEATVYSCTWRVIDQIMIDIRKPDSFQVLEDLLVSNQPRRFRSV